VCLFGCVLGGWQGLIFGNNTILTLEWLKYEMRRILKEVKDLEVKYQCTLQDKELDIEMKNLTVRLNLNYYPFQPPAITFKKSVVYYTLHILFIRYINICGDIQDRILQLFMEDGPNWHWRKFDYHINGNCSEDVVGSISFHSGCGAVSYSFPWWTPQYVLTDWIGELEKGLCSC